MSVTMRDKPYDEKFRLTERNLIVCAFTYMEAGRAVRVVGRRSLGLLKGSLTGRHFPVAGLRALAGVVVRLGAVARERRSLRGRRTRRDGEVFACSLGEETFFDPLRFAPDRGTEAEAFARTRLAALAGR